MNIFIILFIVWGLIFIYLYHLDKDKIKKYFRDRKIRKVLRLGMRKIRSDFWTTNDYSNKILNIEYPFSSTYTKNLKAEVKIGDVLKVNEEVNEYQYYVYYQIKKNCIDKAELSETILINMKHIKTYFGERVYSAWLYSTF